jgi:hypothetical protein
VALSCTKKLNRRNAVVVPPTHDFMAVVYGASCVGDSSWIGEREVISAPVPQISKNGNRVTVIAGKPPIVRHTPDVG